MRRRDLLIGGVCAGVTGLGLARSARAAGWGSVPSAYSGAELPQERQATRLLELFLFGGMGPYEGFYVVPEYGHPDDPDFPNQQWWLFEPDHESMFFDQCRYAPRHATLQPFAEDSLGNVVNLGPIVHAFRDRPDILARTRIVVMRHDIEPHQGAIPFTLTGQRLGSARMCSSGAHFQRYFSEREGARAAPYGAVFYPDSPSPVDFLRPATAVGLHPSSSRPLTLRMGQTSTFPDLLSRSGLSGHKADVDALRALMQAELEGGLVDAAGRPLRSRAVSDHANAISTVSQAGPLSKVLPPEMFQASFGLGCRDGLVLDRTGMSLDAAVSLLTHPTDAARYAMVVDGGMVPADLGSAFDGHDRHLELHARNLSTTLSSLVSHVARPNEHAPHKISLDDTLICLTTEFGRTPVLQPLSDKGTDHNPHGYVQLLIGGPVRRDEAGVVGALGPDAVAVEYATPTEFRVAMMAAMGAWPFATESFTVSDVRGAENELQAYQLAVERVLGVRT